MRKRIFSFIVVIAVVLTSLNLPIASSAATLSDGNLLYGLTATTIAEHFNGWYESNRPLSKLTDGNTYVGVGYNAGNMFVTPYDANGNAYVDFSFDAPTTLNKVIVYFPGYNAVEVNNQVRDYVVDVQLENGSWRRVGEMHNEERSHWDAYSDTLCFAPVTCKSLRITCVNTHGQSSIGFYEIEAYYDTLLTSDDYTEMDSYDYTVDAIPLPEINNVLLGVGATANNAADSSRPLSNLTDGYIHTGGYNRGKYAATKYDDAGEAYINFAFAESTLVNKIVIHWPGTSNGIDEVEQVTDYAIDVCTEDGVWTRVAEQHTDTNSAWAYYVTTLCFKVVECKQIRITCVNANGQTYANFGEIEAYHSNTMLPEEHTAIDSKDYTVDAIPLPEMKNVLLGVGATANNAADSSRPLSNLTDGYIHTGGYNRGKYAATKYDDAGEAYINFAFAESTLVNKIVIHWPGTSNGIDEVEQVTDYAIDVCTEDGVWTRVAEQHTDTNSAWAYYVTTLCFETVECKQIRITCVNVNNQTYANFGEIEAYHSNTITSEEHTAIDSKDYTNSAIPFPEIKNVLLGVGATANNAADSSRPLSNLTDGYIHTGGYNRGKYAATKYNDAGEAFINFTFAESTVVNQIVIHWPGTSNGIDEAEQVRDYAIDVCSKDGVWTRVAEQHTDTNSAWAYYVTTLCFEAVECKQIRITCVNANGQTYANFGEIEAYHSNAIAPEEYTAINSKDNTLNAIPLPDICNVLLGVGATANNAADTSRPLSNLTDGYIHTDGYNRGKYAATKYNDAGEAYINFVFAENTRINQIVIHWPGTSNGIDEAEQVRDYAIDVCAEDGVWTRVAEQHTNSNSAWAYYVTTLCFATVECKQIRITCVNANGQTYANFGEIEAYCSNAIAPEEYTPFDTGVTILRPKSADWVTDEVPTLDDFEYSFAVVGDTQIVSKNDAVNGTTDLLNLYQYIIDKKDEFKISQVIGLGDLVDTYADGAAKEAEWNVALNAIKQLDGVLPYTLVPGNHDVNWNFNYRVGNISNLGYLNQSQIISKYGKAEAGQTTEEPSASNTAHAFTAGGRNYLILTLEYAAISTPGVMEWANAVVAAHPYHNVIVTTHAYLAADGSILDGSQEGSPSSYTGSETHNNGDYFWDNLIRKHDNIVMVLCGHVGTDNIVKTTKVGDKGNTVTQIMVNPQDLEAEIGNTGMLAFMYFSEDGKTVQLRQYSTVWDRYYGNESQTTFTISVIEPLQGDINADREVDVRDLIRYKKYVLKADNNVVISELTSDLNHDGEFDTDDSIILRNLLVGVECFIDSNADKSIVYLSEDGKDTWTGTELQPYGSLEKALAAVQDNGFIQIQGTYTLGDDFVWEKHNKTVTISGGVLDGTLLGNTISLGDHVTFDDITLNFTKNSYLFANGYSLTIKENITMPNRIRIYGGGQSGTTVASTDLKIYGGNYEAIFGGSNGGTVTGNTNVVVDGNVNEGITPVHDATDYFVYGGGVADIVNGSTNVTFGGNAKAHYVFGGSYGESAEVLQGTNVYITGGTVSGVYGGSKKGGTGKSGAVTGEIYVEMTGGTVDQLFGGNEASDMTGDVEVKVLSGTVTRRIYGGCYNEYDFSWASSYSVKGTITLILSGNANLAQSYSWTSGDLSVFARSRINPKSDEEVSQLIYVDGGEAHESKLGAHYASMMSSVSAYDSCTTQ